jgi:hypothetical protein
MEARDKHAKLERRRGIVTNGFVPDCSGGKVASLVGTRAVVRSQLILHAANDRGPGHCELELEQLCKL